MLCIFLFICRKFELLKVVQQHTDGVVEDIKKFFCKFHRLLRGEKKFENPLNLTKL